MYTVNTSIDRVTIFNQAALVTRTGKIPPLNGNNIVKLHIKNLPLAFLDDSLRVGVVNKSSWAVSNVSIEIDKSMEDIKKLDKDDLKKLEEELENFQHEAKIINLQAGRVKQWMSLAVPQRKGETEKPEEEEFHFNAWQAYIKNCEGKLESLYKKLEELNWKETVLLDEIIARTELLQAENSLVLQDNIKFHKNLIVTLLSIDRRELYPEELALSYIIPGARWSPIYKLYIQDNYKKAILVMGAQIAQSSGEEWDNVKLGFSSAVLERNSQLPDLPSRRIGRAQSYTPPSFREKKPPSEEVFRSFDEWYKEAKIKISGLKEPCEDKISQPSGLISRREPSRPRSALLANTFQSLPPPCEAFPELDDVCPVMEMSCPADSEVISPEPFLPQDFQEKAKKMDDYASLSKPKARFMARKEMAPPPAPSMPAGAPGSLPGGGGAFYEEEEREIFVTSSGERKETTRDYLNYELMSPDNMIYRGQLRKVRAIKVTAFVTEKEEVIYSAIKRAKDSTYVKPFTDQPLPSIQFVYHASGRANVPSDGQPHTVDIMSGEAISSITYLTIPMTDQEVFKRLTIKNPFSAPIPQGTVQVFVDSAYVFTTFLKSVGIDGQAYFPLGVEQSIKVSRNTSFSQEEKGFITSSSTARHRVEIALKSNLDETVSVRVIERLPVAHDEEENLNVNIVLMNPECKEVEFIDNKRLRGAHEWNIELPPGSRAVAEIEYDILLSSKMEISGGNRRV